MAETKRPGPDELDLSRSSDLDLLPSVTLSSRITTEDCEFWSL